MLAAASSEKTYALDDASIFGYGVLPVSAPDTPDDPDTPDEPDLGPQPICGLEAHTHGPDCYSEDGLLICPLPQHTHTADCYEQLEEQTPLCGLNEHTHTESCYDADGTLLCTLPEHTHTDSCYLPQEPAKQDFSYDDAQLHLRITVESPQPLPEGTALAVQTVDADSTLLSASASSGAEQWIVRQIGLTQAETPVDTSEMTLTAEVLVKSAALSSLFEQADEDILDADTGVTVSVMQADEDAGLQEVESVTVTPGESVPVLTVSVQDGTLVLLASSANPEFTVQYYAEIPRFASEGHAALTIFDTSGQKLPTNSTTNPTRELHLTEAGTLTSKNAGNATQEYVVATTPELTRMYADNTFEYVSAPEPKYVDKLMDNEHYQIKEIWVLKDGRDGASTSADDWDVYTYTPTPSASPTGRLPPRRIRASFISSPESRLCSGWSTMRCRTTSPPPPRSMTMTFPAERTAPESGQPASWASIRRGTTEPARTVCENGIRTVMYWPSATQTAAPAWATTNLTTSI